MEKGVEQSSRNGLAAKLSSAPAIWLLKISVQIKEDNHNLMLIAAPFQHGAKHILSVPISVLLIVLLIKHGLVKDSDSMITLKA